MMKRFSLVAVMLGCLALSAPAADLVEAPGGQLNGGDPGSLPRTLEAGDLVTGPATVRTASGDTLLVGPDGVLEVQEPEEGKEFFFVKAGAVRGRIGDKTTIAVPTGWLAVPTGGEADFYARTMDASRGFFQVRSGVGLVSYDAMGSMAYPRYRVLLQGGQGIEMWSPSRGNFAFLTPQENEGNVILSAEVTDRTEIRLVVPKATAGSLVQEEGNKTLVTSEAGSWKGGQIGGNVFLFGEEEPTDTAVLGPGTFVRIDNATGKVLTFEQVKFEIIERAVSLTSEFSAVSTSNFFSPKFK